MKLLLDTYWNRLSICVADLLKDTFSRWTWVFILVLTLTACTQKELCEDHTHVREVEVVFDWSNAPDASPASMTYYFFNTDNPSAPPVRHDFAGRDGGSIRLTAGNYSAIGFSSDNTDWARFRDTEDIESFAVVTRDADVLPVFGIDVRVIHKVRDSEDERIAVTPDMLWNNRQDNIELPRGTGKHVVTFYPQEVVCHYTVTVLEVENIKYVRGALLDATLSGMAEGYHHGRDATTETHVTMPFVLHNPTGTNTLYSEFLTFGECPQSPVDHEITIYMVFDDGSARYFTFDVTDQVKNAPDPRHVDIVIRGLVLPKPITNGGGLKPSVEDWESQYEDIIMQ